MATKKETDKKWYRVVDTAFKFKKRLHQIGDSIQMTDAEFKSNQNKGCLEALKEDKNG